MTYLEILKRCCESPEVHLAKPSVLQFEAYEFGYQICHSDRLEGLPDIKAIQRAIITDYQLPSRWPYNLNFRTFLTAVEGEVGSLRKYHEYRQRFTLPSEPEPKWPMYCLGLFESIRTEGFRKRPGMYFGNDVSSAHMWSMVSGACWAERDSASGPGEACDFMESFQAWIEARFPYCRGIPWHRSLYFLSLSCCDISLRTFFDCFDLFMAGEPPDCLSTIARTIVENIGECSNMSRDELEQTSKGIAPI